MVLPPRFKASRACNILSAVLFRALDTLGWDGVIRTKGSVWVQSDGLCRPLYGYALDRPVLKDLPAVRYGRRYGKDAYPCRVIVYAEPG